MSTKIDVWHCGGRNQNFDDEETKISVGFALNFLTLKTQKPKFSSLNMMMWRKLHNY